MSLSQSFSQKIGNVRPLNPCPSLDIDFANGGYVNTGGFANQESVGSANFNIGAFNGPDPIFTRATAATFRGSDGLIQYAPENLLLRSEEFSDTAWSRSGILPFGSGSIANATAAPNGQLSADLIVPSTNNVSQIIYNSSAISSSQARHIWSLYAKSAGYDYVSLIAVNASLNIRYSVTVSLTNGQVTKVSSLNSPTGTAYSIIEIGGGWYRIAISMDLSGGSGNYFSICPSSTATPIQDSVLYNVFAGNGTSGIYIWGAQLERSSTARPYISTTSAARYGPRFEYDLNGNPLGLLMEEQSQNLLSYSEQFDNASWTPSNLNTTGTPAWINTETAPNGTITAEKLIENNQNNYHYVTRVGGVAVVNGTAHTWSVYAKKAERSWLVIDAYSSTGATCWFDLNNGVTGTTAAGATSSIVSVGNGWYRCSVTRTTATTSASMSLSISTGNGVSAYLGNGTSGIYIWGAQLEQKPFATSYMPTVGGPMTRNADVVNSTIGSWYNTDEGTIVVKGDRTGFNIQDSLFEFEYSSIASLTHRGDGTDENFLVEDAATTVTIVETVPLNSPLYFAASYSDPALQISATVNGEPVQGTTLESTITTPTTLNIGYSPEISTYFNGHIKAFRYYAKALPSKLEFFTRTA